jgi:hypothetical protein
VKHVFVSHVYEDRGSKNTLDGWERADRLGQVRLISETADVRQHGEQAIKEHVARRLRPCTVLLVLVGDNSHNHPWLDYEVQYAKSHGLAVVLCRLPGTRGAAPTVVRFEPEVAFEPGALRRALGT